MSHLSNKFFELFLKRIQENEDIPSDFKKEISSLYSEKKISRGNHLKELLNKFNLQQLDKNENSEH